MRSDICDCSRLLHRPEEQTVKLIKEASKKKAFKLQLLMARKKETLGLEIFKLSKVKASMLAGSLPIGSQIWVYHDRETDPGNPVAVINPYCHVVVYTGCTEVEGEEVHEVVHVSLASKRGLAKAKITKQNVETVIKADNYVFLGHQLEICQFAANMREKIAERAIACVQKPTIVFDYNLQ